MRGHRVVWAIFRRDTKSWFASPTGYVFITVFALLCALAQFVAPRFFQDNTASLASLAEWFRYLLLFFIPAVTMVVWAGERSRGTDEILLTLPASDTQIVIGKFLAAAGIYSVSLLFTLLLPVWLSELGDPDWGLVFSSYMAFWCLGIFLVSAGMVGSQLTDNLTVAFILGALFCAAVVFIEDLLGLLSPGLLGAVQGHDPMGLFDEMMTGLVSLKALVFFGVGSAVFLYVNVLLLGRCRPQNAFLALRAAARHCALIVGVVSLTVLVGWRGARFGRPGRWLRSRSREFAGAVRRTERSELRGFHGWVRLFCLLVGLLAATSLAGRWGARLDCTSEGLHTLSDVTCEILDDLDPEHPVTIRAWVSPEAPKEYGPVRRELLDLLREYDSRGGEALEVEVIETKRHQEEAREAERNFGITYKTVATEEGSRRREFDLYLGVAVTCGAEEVVVPFLDKGLSVEYELTRSIRVVTGAARSRVGVLDTDVQMFGGMDMTSFSPLPEWEIIRELKLQYDVVKVPSGQPYPDDLDLILVAMPSTLRQSEMDHLKEAIRGGTPALLFDDPLPFVAAKLRPSAPKAGRRDPMSGRQMPDEEGKGDIRGLLETFGIDWAPDQVAFDGYNPHPKISRNPEMIFVGKQEDEEEGGEPVEPFNSEEAITSGLQEVLIFFGGCVTRAPAAEGSLEFVPLLRSARESGVVLEKDLLTQTFYGLQLNESRPHVTRPGSLTLACRVRGKVDPEAGKEIDLVFVADLDMINHPALWYLRREGDEDFRFDNITFILNCVDELVGETDFVTLRKRRPRDRRLTTIEAYEAKYRKEMLRQMRDAERKAEAQLEAARGRLKRRIEAIRNDPELDEMTKRLRIETVEGVEERRFRAASSKIEDEKNSTMDRERGILEDKISKDQNRYRARAVGLSPAPAVLVGLFIFFLRWLRERRSIPDIRSVRGGER